MPAPRPSPARAAAPVGRGGSAAGRVRRLLFLLLLLAPVGLASAGDEGDVDLVLTTFGANKQDAKRPDASLLELFVCSLRRWTSPDRVKVVVFADVEIEGVDALAARCPFELVKFDLSDAPQNFYITTTRYVLYRRILMSIPREDRRRLRYVFLTDCRDVWIQSNPFDAYQEWVAAQPPTEARERLAVFLESQRHVGPTVGSCVYNLGWLVDCFPELRWDFPLALWDQPVSCAGTQMGTAGAIAAYVDALLAAADRARCQAYGLDQAVHNWLLSQRFAGLGPVPWWHGDGPPPPGPFLALDVVPLDHGFIGTFAKVPSSELALDGFGRVLDAAGRPYAVVHQWDRHAALGPLFARLARTADEPAELDGDGRTP